MNTNKKVTIGGGSFGLLEVILVVNIILKLLGKITWSWPVVLWPLWVSIGAFVIFIIIVYLLLKR